MEINFELWVIIPIFVLQNKNKRVMLGKYDVEIEFLDEFGNVVDSSEQGLFDNYKEAAEFAESVELHSDNEQVAIWLWDDDETVVEDSWVVKTFNE